MDMADVVMFYSAAKGCKMSFTCTWKSSGAQDQEGVWKRSDFLPRCSVSHEVWWTGNSKQTRWRIQSKECEETRRAERGTQSEGSISRRSGCQRHGGHGDPAGCGECQRPQKLSRGERARKEGKPRCTAQNVAPKLHVHNCHQGAEECANEGWQHPSSAQRLIDVGQRLARERRLQPSQGHPRHLRFLLFINFFILHQCDCRILILDCAVGQWLQAQECSCRPRCTSSSLLYRSGCGRRCECRKRSRRQNLWNCGRSHSFKSNKRKYFGFLVLRKEK